MQKYINLLDFKWHLFCSSGHTPSGQFAPVPNRKSVKKPDGKFSQGGTVLLGRTRTLTILIVVSPLERGARRENGSCFGSWSDHVNLGHEPLTPLFLNASLLPLFEASGCNHLEERSCLMSTKIWKERQRVDRFL